MHKAFQHFALATSRTMGSAAAFGIGVAIVVIWAATGPAFHFSENWQLVINTGTTIITFLMVFLIQYSQNRDTEALHLKIDELIRATQKARNELVDLEEESDERLQEVKKEFRKLSGSGIEG